MTYSLVVNHQASSDLQGILSQVSAVSLQINPLFLNNIYYQTIDCTLKNIGIFKT